MKSHIGPVSAAFNFSTQIIRSWLSGIGLWPIRASVRTFADDLVNAVEAANIGFARLDAKECFEQTNPAFAAMLGRKIEEFAGRNWRCSVHPEDHARVEEAYRCARNGLRNSVEIRGLRADGSILYQALTVSRRNSKDGELAGYHTLHHDISGYKSDQEALSLAVESAPNGLLMLGPAGRILFVNAAVERLFGYSRKELLDQPVETLLPERFTADESIRLAGRDLIGRRKDGVEIPLQVHLNTIDAPAGRLILCTIIDIAERIRYQEQLELAKHAAESANRHKSDFLARMSHEIRTPVNLIIGMNALLLESELNTKQRQQVEISYRNVKRLLRLINGILDLSNVEAGKVEAGKLTLASVWFDLREVLAEAIATVSSAAGKKGLDLNVTVDPNTWPYWVGDHERLQQVLLNLVGNAAKFTAQGKIDVRVGPAQASEGADGIQFEVSDTGCGIPPDQAGLIFEAFQQADGAMNWTYEGIGLGLAIAKTLVEMMGGRIWTIQKESPGATFFFTVFFQRSAPKREGGCSLVMDGYTATREIRRWERSTGNPAVPVIALTAHALSHAPESWEAGCNGHVSKPVEREELIDAIAKFSAPPQAEPAPHLDKSIQSHRPTFLAKRHEDLARIQEALVASDIQTIQRIGHNCKGIGKGYGFPGISVAGAILEGAARAAGESQDRTGLRAAVARFSEAVDAASAGG